MRRALATTGAAAVLGGALMVAPAGAAHAGTDCGGTVWPDIYVTVREVRPDRFEGRHLVLRNGRASDGSYGAIASGFRSGDRVWIDRRAPGSSSYFTCGPFNRWDTNRMDNFGWQMRACADIAFGGGRLGTCTDWYTDQG
jgi:hypothetical protein